VIPSIVTRELVMGVLSVELLYNLKPKCSYDFCNHLEYVVIRTWAVFLSILDINNLMHASWQDIEQLLNYIGAESLGPRHELTNLKQLTTIIQSQQYISTD
jgi:hypothetical protein